MVLKAPGLLLQMDPTQQSLLGHTHQAYVIPYASTPDVQTPSMASVMRPITPALADAQVLGGYGYAPSSLEVGKGLEALATSPGTIDISSYNILGWSVTVMFLPAVPIKFYFYYDSYI